jgi:phage recombination protein Bet
MNQVAIRKEQNSQKLMLLDFMADKYSLTPDEFRKTVRATCGLSTATSEQVAAFLIVCKQYNLNPLTREIYAFPGRNGGVVPIVSIDGWVNLVNSNKHCDGFEFDMEHIEGDLISCTCRMYRKDRSHPVTVTEYLSECARNTEPWKMRHRMLRHKSLIQAARYAFGFAGIYDEDEGRTIAEAVDVTPRPRVPSPSEAVQIEAATIDQATMDDIQAVNARNEKAFAADLSEQKLDPITTGPQPKAKSSAPDIRADYDGWYSWALDKISHADDGGWLETFWNDEIEPVRKEIFPSDLNDLSDVLGKAQNRLNSDD